MPAWRRPRGSCLAKRSQGGRAWWSAASRIPGEQELLLRLRAAARLSREAVLAFLKRDGYSLCSLSEQDDTARWPGPTRAPRCGKIRGSLAPRKVRGARKERRTDDYNSERAGCRCPPSAVH